MGVHNLVHSLFAMAGILALLAALFNWDWFFTAQNAQFIVQRLKRPYARLLYGILGIVLITLSLSFFFKYRQSA
ncbi:MAG: hypothetical protein E7099_07110 [Mediterranea massiliensis]|nr:hypothetical protein [Mediterranea massiliensis]